MGLSCKTCFSKLLFRLPRGTIVHELPFEAIARVVVRGCRAKATSPQLFLKLLRGTVVQKLPSQATYQAFAWNCRAKVALWSYFLSFCMELSCTSCLAKLFLKLLHGTVIQNMLCQAVFWAHAWKCRAKAACRSYFFGFCLELSSESWPAKLPLNVKCHNIFRMLRCAFE